MTVRYAAAIAACLAMSASAGHAAPLKPALSGLDFLLGNWASGTGQVAETGGGSKGSSSITLEAGGAVILRRDHVDLFDKTGKPAGGFDILMTIYGAGGAIHADYFDGTHIIHYISAKVSPGRSVVFDTNAEPGAPSFRLSYTRDQNRLAVSFAMAPPGQTAFHPIADGTLTRKD